MISEVPIGYRMKGAEMLLCMAQLRPCRLRGASAVRGCSGRRATCTGPPGSTR